MAELWRGAVGFTLAGQGPFVCLCLLGCSMSIWQRPHLIINNRFVREKRRGPLRHAATLKTAVPSQFELHCFNWWLACSCCVGSLRVPSAPRFFFFQQPSLSVSPSICHFSKSSRDVSMERWERCSLWYVETRRKWKLMLSLLMNTEKLETWKMSITIPILDLLSVRSEFQTRDGWVQAGTNPVVSVVGENGSAASWEGAA